jgi:hypothetical protein
MTGPTSVASNAGSPITSSAIAPAALTGAVEGGSEHVGDDLLGERRGIDDHRILPAGLGDKRHDRTGAAREVEIDAPCRFGRAGKGDPGDARVGNERRTDRFAGPRQQMQDLGWNARLEQQAHRGSSDQRGLLGRLGNNGIAGRERRGDLAGEDRQWKIPRRNAREDAAAVQFDLVALAGGAGERRGAGKIRSCTHRVVAQIIDRLAHFAEGRRDRAPALADDQRHQLGHAALEKIGRRIEFCRPLGHRGAVPHRGAAHRPGKRPIDIGRPGRERFPDPAPPIARVEHRLRGTALLDAADDRRGPPRLLQRLGEGRAQSRQCRRIVEVEPLGVLALRAVEVPWQRDTRMRLHRQLREPRDRVGDDLVDRLAVVDDAVDERRVGAVFEQPPDEIRQQVLVTADRSIDPARPIEMPGRLAGPDDLLVESLSHAVQALKLPVPPIAGHFEHRGHGVSVVGRELWIEGGAVGEQPVRAGEIRHIGRDLARIDRVTVEPTLLRALDLAVPVGAFDEANH